MKPVYVQHLLKVLLEEYQDIDYMLDTMVATHPTRRDSEKIRRLLNQLSQQNEKLLEKFPEGKVAGKLQAAKLRAKLHAPKIQRV